MSGWSSHADVDTTIKETLRQAGKDPRDYNISGIRREAFYQRGHTLGWGTMNAALSKEGWDEIVSRNRRTRKPTPDTADTQIPGNPADSGKPTDAVTRMKLADAVRDVVDYNWPHELTDFQQQDDEGRERHVFRSLVVLANWLGEARDDTTAGGVETERHLTLWVHTEELWRDLEAAAGLAKYELGRFKEWNALGPAHFASDQFDLDVMIAWARDHGIPYTEERAVHYNGTTGVVDLASQQLHRKTIADRLDADPRARNRITGGKLASDGVDRP